MSVEYGFGIDLGTTNSAVARSNGVEVRVYQNNDQMSVTPSAVHIFKSGRLLVGKRAYNAVISDIDNVALEFKRSMGQKVGKSFPASGRNMSPEELSAEILKSLKDDVRRQTQEDIQRAVITVPAAFGTLQCEATSRAAKLAGITETYLLQEPIAAAIAYGMGPDARDQYWLVFDLGGGTLDIAVVSTRQGRLTVLEHQGNNLLGGKDMDRLIVERIFMPVLNRKFELPDPTSPEWERLFRRLRMIAEDAKIDLSTRDSVVATIVDIGLDRHGAPIEAEVEVTRAAFEREIDSLVQTCLQLTRGALSGARLSASALDRILLVGGPTHIPYLRAALIDGVGDKLDFSIDPMTVVARGAAIFASSVDWAKPAASSGKPAGNVGLILSYGKVSTALEEPVTGRVTAPNDVEAIKIDAEGGFWTSGWVPLVNNVFDELPVRLVEGKLTQYFVYARQADGSLVDLEPNAFSIRHGLPSGAPPLPCSVWIEVVRPDGKAELDIVFPKNTPLPATRTVSYRAVRELRPSQVDESLAAKVWEGETPQDPDANRWVGAMKIFGSHLRRPILQGAEIRLTVHIDESRRVSVDALVPHSNESFSEGIYLPEEEQPDPREQVRKLPSAITPLIERLDAVEKATDDPDVLEEVMRVRGVLEEADIEGTGMDARPDDPDFADRLVQRVNGTRVDIAALEKKTQSGAVSAVGFEKAKRQAGVAKEIVEKFGADSDKSELAKMTRDLERAESRVDSRSARKLGEQLQSLRWRVLFNQDWFWKDAFEALKQPGQKFVNQQAARKWLDAGELAIRKGDSISLRESVNNLWSVQSKADVAIAKERAEHSGLCRY